MSKAVYDTRLFIEYFYSNDAQVQTKVKEEIRRSRNRFVSAITLHENFKLTLERGGRETARLRMEVIKDYFEIVSVDSEVAVLGADLRHKYRIPMGDSIIAATTSILKATCVTDDPHLSGIREIKSKWI